MIIQSFLYGDTLPNLGICDQLIDYHKNSDRKGPGLIVKDGIPIEDKTRKHSIDVGFVVEEKETIPVLNDYLSNLLIMANRYIDKFPWSASGELFGVKETISLQHYPPGAGYHEIHCERSSNKQPQVSRHLVFMTYLNDVTDGGETEWIHQELKIQPRKGLTVIWPADWTFVHRGIVSPTQDKYIITGWFNYI